MDLVRFLPFAGGGAAPSRRVDRARKKLRARGWRSIFSNSGAKLRLSLWQELSSLLSHFDPPKALEIIQKGHSQDGRAPDDVVAVAAEAWILKLRDGQSFPEVIIGWCSDKERMLITAGHMTKSLPVVLRDMANAEGQLLTVKSKWQNGLWMPGALIVFGWGMVVYFSSFTADFLASNPTKDDVALIALAATTFVNDWLSWLVPAMSVVLIAATLLVMKFWLGRHRPAVERYWPFSLYKAVEAADFLVAYRILKKAEYDESRALLAMRPVAGRYLKWQIDALEENSRGKPWGETLSLSGRSFPDAQVNALMATFSVDQKTYPEHLSRIADEWNASLVARMEASSAATTFWATVIVGILQAVAGLLLSIPAMPQD